MEQGRLRPIRGTGEAEALEQRSFTADVLIFWDRSYKRDSQETALYKLLVLKPLAF